MKKVIARILKDARKDCGLSAQQVVEKLNDFGIQLSPVTLFGYENEHSTPNADTFVCLCRIYGMTEINIFFGDNKPKKEPTQYEQLNEAGQFKVMEYIDDLIENSKYSRRLYLLPTRSESKSDASGLADLINKSVNDSDKQGEE